MRRKLAHLPIGLLIAAVLLVLLGVLFRPAGGLLIPADRMENDIFLIAIPFLATFIAIILTFIFSIFVIARLLNGQLSSRTYSIIEGIILGGIALGVFSMFQPISHAIFSKGFLLLLGATLSFIVWSHIVPRGASRPEDAGPVSVRELEDEPV
jgi:hypothetical protein